MKKIILSSLIIIIISIILFSVWYYRKSSSWTPQILGAVQVKDYLVNDYIAYASDQAGHLDIYWLDWQDKQENLLVDQSIDYAPAFMFGSKKVIFISQQKEFSEIWRHEIDGQKNDLITASTGYPIYYKISPNGKKMIYLEYNENNKDALYIFGPLYLIDLISGRTQLINNNASFPEWDKDSQYLIYSVSTETAPPGNYKICLRDLNQQGTLGQEQDIYLGGISPLYFPSQEEIIFTKLDSKMVEIGKINLTRPEAEVITNFDFFKEEGIIMNYQLSPDQSRLLFSRVIIGESHQEEIWVVGINGRNPKRLIEHAHAPVWSRTDNKIVYTKSGQQENVWIMDVTGLNQKQLTTHGNNWFPVTTVSMSSNPGILLKSNFDNFYLRYDFN